MSKFKDGLKGLKILPSFIWKVWTMLGVAPVDAGSELSRIIPRPVIIFTISGVAHI